MVKFEKWEKNWIEHEKNMWGYRHSYLMYQLEFIRKLFKEREEKIRTEARGNRN